MTEEFIRSEMLLGEEAMEKLSRSTVAVFGLGGVGGYVAEALCRSGVGKFILVDNDVVSVSNINRQIIALSDTVGRYKTDVMSERMKKINPCVEIKTFRDFFLPGNSDIINSGIDYIADAIDTVSGKIELVTQAKAFGIPIISCMGTGNKLNPAMFEVSDIYSTSVCPLAKVMRKELKNRGIERLKAVYSKEKPLKPLFQPDTSGDRPIPGSVSFAPSVAGLIMASEIIKDLGGIVNG